MTIKTDKENGVWVACRTYGITYCDEHADEKGRKKHRWRVDGETKAVRKSDYLGNKITDSFSENIDHLFAYLKKRSHTRYFGRCVEDVIVTEAFQTPSERIELTGNASDSQVGEFYLPFSIQVISGDNERNKSIILELEEILLQEKDWALTREER